MKCFYHNDLDGRCAGSVVALYENNYRQEDFYEVDYVQDLPIEVIEENEKVYLVDYSFKAHTLEQLKSVLQKTTDIVWIDHHDSSIKLEQECEWLKIIEGVRTKEASGAALAYMHLFNKSLDDIPYYIKLVSDYDCWQYKYDPDTTLFKIGVETKNHDALDYVWSQLHYEHSNGSYDLLYSLISNGKIIKDYIDKNNNYYRESFAYETEVEGHKCLAVNKKTNSWIFGEKYTEYPMVMVWVFNGDKYIYSIYSNDPNVDCRVIAEKYGGGGHKGAAGFTSDVLLFSKR